METAQALLGRPHRIHGTVIPGNKRGRTIGFDGQHRVAAELVPLVGVYAVRARIDGGRWQDGGEPRRPTDLRQDGFSIEVHLLDFRGDIYAAQVEVAPSRAPGRRFADILELQAQIQRDVVDARARLAGRA